MIVLIDNGHGNNTPGKCNSDKTIREYAYVREIAARIYEELTSYGIPCELLVKEKNDIPLKERVARANSYNDAILVSVHLNAAGNGSCWCDGCGWSAFVSKNASDNSKLLASCMTEQAKKEGLKIRYEYPNINYWQSNLYICKNTNCPAVLTENLFMDNPCDSKFLLSDEGKDTIVRIHTYGIVKYLQTKGLFLELNDYIAEADYSHY